MRPTCLIGRAGIAMALGALLGIGHPRMAAGQELANRQEPPASAVRRPSATADEEIKSIDDDYVRQLQGLERRRLERLGNWRPGRHRPMRSRLTRDSSAWRRPPISSATPMRPRRPSSMRAALRRS